MSPPVHVMSVSRAGTRTNSATKVKDVQSSKLAAAAELCYGCTRQQMRANPLCAVSPPMGWPQRTQQAQIIAHAQCPMSAHPAPSESERRHFQRAACRTGARRNGLRHASGWPAQVLLARHAGFHPKKKVLHESSIRQHVQAGCQRGQRMQDAKGAAGAHDREGART